MAQNRSEFIFAAFRRMVSTLLKVNGRGYWETSDENLEKLQELYHEVEDRIEGIE